MSGCKIYELPQHYFDRWDIWTLCEAVGGCDQDVCTAMKEISEAWACEKTRSAKSHLNVPAERRFEMTDPMCCNREPPPRIMEPSVDITP